MKAIVYDRYGPPEVAALQEVALPTLETDGVLVKVQATSVTTADWRLRASAFPGIMWLPGRLMFGLLRPKHKTLGGDFSGRVEAVGGDVTAFKPGDEVYGFSTLGAHADYLAIPEGGAIARKPPQMSFEEAAAIPFGALSALVFLRDVARVQPGQKVLIVGASGGVGAYAVQIARHFGAEVTGVCSTPHLDFAKGLGANHVIDYTAADFTQSAHQYDVIFDTIGVTSFRSCKRSLTASGVFVPLNFGLGELVQALAVWAFSRKRMAISVSGDNKQDLEVLNGLFEAGELQPVIDRQYPLEQIVDAYRFIENRHRKGSVVLTVTP